MKVSDLDNIEQRIEDYYSVKRVSLSKKYPKLKGLIIWSKRLFYLVRDKLNPKIHFSRPKQSETAIDYTKQHNENIVARHQSVLIRTLGTSDLRLQQQKVINIRKACEKLNQVVILPGDIFSLWDIVGNPSEKNGFVNGMLLSDGKVIEGMGGGLCQMSNFLHWIFLHTNVKIIERYHHSRDVFPDSGRTLPFGSGATCLYNFVDLKIQNTGETSLQLDLRVTDKYLKGRVLSSSKVKEKYHLYEKNHCFIYVQNKDQYFRYNELYRDKLIEGKVISTEKLYTNFAPTLYEVTKEYLQSNNYELITI